jgi:RHS repeat-associated protein
MRIKSLVTVLCLAGIAVTAKTQNLNNPNKQGPLGTQVNTLTGNLYIPRTDIYIPGRAFDIDLCFYYNSYLFTEDMGFGRGWSFMYAMKYSNDTLPGSKIIFWGDGREDTYDSLSGGSYKPPRGFFSKLVQYQPAKFRLTESDSITYFFDNAIHKKITRIQEANGNYINFNYTDSLLTSLVNAAGQTITFNYNAEGRLTTLTDAAAAPTRIYTYSYDAVGNLAEVSDPLGGKFNYTYLTNGPMKSLEDKNNNKIDIIYFSDFSIHELIGCNKRISFSYDTTYNKTVVTDHFDDGSANQVTTYTYQKLENLSWISSIAGNCCGFNMKFEYDDQGNQTKITDANGGVYELTYDANGNMLTIKDPLDQVMTYTYSAAYNKITSYKDPKGFLTTMSYDASGNLVQLVAPGNTIYSATYNANGDIISSTDPKGNVFTYNYDAFGNATHVAGPNGYNATLLYDARGNLLAYADARGNSRTAEYDILDRLKKITDPMNDMLQFGYDANDNMTSLINKNNETSQVNYDASNRIVKITGPTGNKSSLSYDAMNNLKSVKNSLGHETKFGYDTRNRPIAMKDPENNLTLYQYDGNNNITSIMAPNGQTISCTYDQLNRLTTMRDDNGSFATLTYDKNNKVKSYTNATGATSTISYDSLGRIKQITDPLANTTSYGYDKNNNIISVTDREGRTRHYTYDSLDRVRTFTDNNGYVITAGYDAMGNVTTLTDQNNNITTYAYDSLNRRKIMTYADGSFIQYGYNKKGNLISKRLTDGSIITYQYDTLNRITSKVLPGGEVYSYTYDKLNRILTAANNSGTATFTYDALNRVTTENFDGRTIRYNYSIAGRTQTVIYPDSTIVIKEFDTRNRLIKIMKDSVTVVEYAYNNFNQLTNKNFANGIATTMQYDFANRLTSINTDSLQNSTFSYNKEYNKTAISRLNNLSLSEQFTYDNGNRLTNYKRGAIGGTPSINNTYAYDAVGNRTTTNLNETTTTYSINNLNQVSGTSGGQNVTFAYETRGNLTYDGTFYKTYDAEGRLLKDSASPTSVIAYKYDALNRRVVKTINGNPLKYTYSGVAQIEERDGSNTLLNRTVFNDFLSPVLNEKNGTEFYYHSNDLNSIEVITNNTGRLIERYQYDVYGKPTRYDSLNNILASSPAGNRFGFTGQEYDSASGSYRFFFRNYSPNTGTFNQRDLIGYHDGTGMYQYVANNPANGVDIWGLQEVGVGDIVGQWSNYTSMYVCGSENGLNNPGTNAFLLSINVINTANGVETLSNWDNNTGAQNFEAALNTASGTSAVTVTTFGLLGATIPTTVTATSATLGTAGTLTIGTAGSATSISVLTAESGLATLAGTGSVGLGTATTGAGVSATGGATLFAGGLFIGAGIAGGLAGYGVADFAFKHTIGDGEGIAQYYEDANIPFYTENIEKLSYKWYRTKNNFSHKLHSAEEWKELIRLKKLVQKKNKECGGGSRKYKIIRDPITGELRIVESYDPNEINGPEGQPGKKWVSVKDRMSYTILCENAKEASAPAKYIRIATPIEPKQDATTFQLGNFSFNNQDFTVPQGITTYTARLDCRDSMGLYVDVIAGYDQVRNEAFWEFQSIDPVTLLPTEDPLKGLLFLQDSLNPDYGHGYFNFSIKPKTNAVTLDTIGARARIVFDDNDTIPTNIYTNTIDAFPPTSSMNDLPDVTPNTEVTISYGGVDDPGGVGLKSYSIYVSDNDGPPQLYVAGFTKTDTTFIGLAEHKYKFYLSAVDSVGNVEELKLTDSVRITSGEQVICPNGSTTFNIKLIGATYQWQVNNGTGYTNITNGGIYSGAVDSILSLNNAPTSMYGFQYRCLINGSPAAEIFLLKFGMTWEGTVSTAWENPANWSCNSLPDMNTDVIVGSGKTNYPQVNSNATIRTLRLNPGATGTVNSGFTLTIVK